MLAHRLIIAVGTALAGGRGRDGPSPRGLGPPPARIPACASNALGSSLGCERRIAVRARGA
jgi:hypothetical protein